MAHLLGVEHNFGYGGNDSLWICDADGAARLVAQKLGLKEELEKCYDQSIKTFFK